MTIQEYITKINTLFITGNAREHSYRGDLQNLIMAILPDVLVTNEPARVACGAPDYVLTRKNIPIGYIEAKDIGVDLKSKTLKEQFDRYKAGLTNLAFTDYLEFQFYRNGELTTKIAIAKIENGQIVGIPENFKQFTQLIKNFAQIVSQTIKSPTVLAQMMAGKAKLMANIIEKSLNKDDQNEHRSNIKSQMLSFQQMLIHDIDNKAFADIYAQTIAYGMFAARYHDPTLESFSRQEAAELIPKSNPFLRKLFQDIAGFDLDDRIAWIVDELVQIFLASDVADIMKNFGKSTKQEDPVVHFYETFLGEYNPALRKARGVWYTPQPVVNFIVRAVDDVLKSEFKLAKGLADTSKTTIRVKTDIANKNFKSGYKEVDKQVHKVQILDPATGTGTFLAEVIKHIHKKFKGQQGIWSNYVSKDLIPRLNGFELLMASYAMAHLKMDMLLTETGYKPKNDQRFNIFLTNSLEEAHKDSGTLFSSWLADEADQANAIKRDAPVMCIIGNPPYSGESSNKGDWIMNLMQDYKKEPGGKIKLKEQNSKFINDDYVKFMRFGQHFIEKNESGVLAFINPHGFLDNPTFRGMRWNLLKTYDKIYTIDLHGNSKKKETCPDGSPDQNVFDIMQGVAITFLVKTGKKKAHELAKVFHYDLFGKRNFKYDFLNDNNLKSINFVELPNKAPNYFMVQKDFEAEDNYKLGFLITDLFKLNSLGIQTHRDSFCIDLSKNLLSNRIIDFYNLNIDNENLKNKYLLKENKDWKLNKQRNGNFQIENIIKINYRPFDTRYLYYDNKIVDRLRNNISKHLLKKDNICLIVPRQCVSDWRYCLVSKNIIESNLTGTAGRFGSGNFFPLYLYPEEKKDTDIFSEDKKGEAIARVPNLDKKIINKLAKKLGLKFTNEKEETAKTFAPIDVLDYIYAVLHSPNYRETYKEFLKIDFPRVPFPKDEKTFWDLVKLGGEIRQIHLLESPIVEDAITQYLGDGDNIITRKLTKTDIGYQAVTDTHGKVWINDINYFDNVPLVAWEFYIGGYQPAQKWLKDRKGRELDYEDIFHYNKIIVALTQTDKIMKEIDLIDFIEKDEK
ncbi:type ISP restriction/modification enzyme [Tenacibaculum finnmarkense]|uniref:type ISP restriction/modification enzyme n=2 Tax=Tenacibaculum finnmarkense TaxID=2781243 RepID=UPI00187BB0E8|nr:type ISP restriction/modification enzyme [Tenacibaculum finnmarkense]MBE7653650.1 N-6 DNA methylase [Tenacibaculum finnmarkense genomovar finnmarkense]MCD8417625.1 N-6 DNA methylase [Tenacibaculum finnmarkense genomovar finnmarkense]MCG8220001.1 N-6 DNA methylase [Tenacibaculum finnmarkense genomovar finnmarkense]MCG8222714.1 N-6 DNA methylase [Tenacibaculum finnmarkense genomovar finnmarkense]MCG8228110.1 N-6 DNA methylase [Tenacibaculum finnmarkense genomovar finnmarkense]